MQGARRTLLLTLLALATPLPALALSDEERPPTPAALSVSTALDSCGIANTGLVCKLDVSFDPIASATSYAASVTRADGSVVDLGAIEPGGDSLWVPYAGSGAYSVRISAYGADSRVAGDGGAPTGPPR